MTKDDVLALLWGQDDFVSGQMLAARLGVSRAAVWKAVEQLRAQGYPIRSLPNRGYRLSGDCDVLSAAGIAKYLRRAGLSVETRDCVTSTNALVRALAEQGAPEGTALIAARQTAGRGRRGREFFSPPGTGLYLSLLLRPRAAFSRVTALTAMAAAATAEAVEALSGRAVQIKWVNDLLMDGRKICGILTEAGVDWESGEVTWAVVGVGIDLRTPEGGFPPELRDVAGAAFDGLDVPDLRCRLAAAVLDGLMDGYGRLGDRRIWQDYCRRCVVPGRAVRILLPGREPVPAQALAVNEDFSLSVRLSDGTEQRLSAGEVSLRLDEKNGGSC